ncbi:hypothetical protein ACMFMF_000724 [Clarireedia jacksonii]
MDLDAATKELPHIKAQIDLLKAIVGRAELFRNYTDTFKQPMVNALKTLATSGGGWKQLGLCTYCSSAGVSISG